MATQQEINQLLGTWAANFLKLAKTNIGSKPSWTLWYNKYIAPLYPKQISAATISLPTISPTQRNMNAKGGLEPNPAYYKAIISQIYTLRSELPGILNTLQIKNAGEILAEFDKIIFSTPKGIK